MRKSEMTLLTLASAARHLGIPRSTLKYRVLTGDIKRRTLGPVWVIDVEEAKSVMEGVGYRPRKPVTA
jgi:hypothetical protein